MAELKPMEVIMLIDFVASDREQICAHAEKVQELIRCKDCKHRPYMAKRKHDGRLDIYRPLAENPEYEGQEDMTCPFLCYDSYYDRMPDDDFFCAYGEARNEI